MSIVMADLSQKSVGFLGVGKISSCVVRGIATSKCVPKRIYLSPRNATKAAALKADFPDLIEVMDSNEAVVGSSDIVFIGLLPGVAREILPPLDFTTGGTKQVVSMMATIDIGEMLSLTKLPAERVVRTVPLPSSARGEGPCLVHPILPDFLSILKVFSTPIGCAEEAEMKPLIALTGHISSFFELMNVSERFMIDKGVGSNAARGFVSSFYSSLARSTEFSSESFADMAEEAATPGGLNEQTLRAMKGTEHFSVHTNSLSDILDRLQGK